MDEFAAPEAERQFLTANRGQTSTPAHAQIRVHRGFGVIEDLIVDGQPIKQWLETRTAREREGMSTRVTNKWP